MKKLSRNVWKNALSIVLAVCMVLGMCTTALATGNDNVTEVSVLSELQSALTNGGNVKLNGNITAERGLTVPAGKTVTLDLNGHTVSMTDSSCATSALIMNNGTLVIKDTVGGGKLTYKSTTPDSSFNYATNTITNAGSLTVLGGIIENTTAGGASYAIDTAWTGSGTVVSLNIAGGTISAARTGVRICSYSGVTYNVDIAGGSITGSYALQIYQPNEHILDVNLNITGGTFNATDTAYPYAIEAYYLTTLGDSVFNISGGTFEDCIYINTSSDFGTAKVNITGGTFNNDVYVCGAPSVENVSISGGTFNGYYGFYTDATIPVISGGTFTTDYGKYYANAYLAPDATFDSSTGTVTPPDSTLEENGEGESESINTVEQLLSFITEYYDDAYAYGKEQGYIDSAVTAIDGAIAAVEGVDLDGTEFENSKQEIIGTLEAAKKLLKEADVLDQATLEAATALLNEAGEALDALIQAATVVNNTVIIPALKEAHKELTEVIIPEIIADLQEAVDKATDIMLEKLGEAYDEFVDYVVEAAKKYAPEVDAWLYDYLYNNPTEVIAFFNEYSDEIEAFFAEYGDEALMVIGYLVEEYGDDVAEYVLAHPVEVLTTMAKWVDEHGDEAWALIMVYLNELGLIDVLTDPENLEKVLEEVEKLIAAYGPEILDEIYNYVDELGYIEALESIVKALEAEAERLKNEVIPEIMDTIEDLKAELADLKAELEKLYAELENATGEAREAILEAIAKIEAAIAEIEATIEALKEAVAEIEAQIEAVLAAAAELAAAIDNLLDVIANAGEDISAAIDKVQAALDKIGEVVDFVGDVIDTVNGAIDRAQELVAKAISEALKLRDEIKAAIEELKQKAEELTGEAKEFIEKIIPELEKAAEFFDSAVTTIAKKAEVVADKVADVVAEVTAAVEEAVAEFEAAYVDATTAEYEVSENSYYVSIGDGSVLSAESDFGYKLAVEIGLDVDTQFAQLGIDGLRAEDILALLDPTFVTDGYGAAITAAVDADAYVAEIKKADLITVGLGQNNISEFVMNQVMGYAVYDLGLEDYIEATPAFAMDWSRYVGAENVPYIEGALADVYNELVANGVPEVMPYEYAVSEKVSFTVNVPVADIITYMVECYAYGYAGYAATYAQTLNAIHAVNPDAEVIAVGMYNPIENLVIDVNGTTIELGGFVDGLVEMSNAYGLVYAMVAPNTTFVAAPAVETYFEATGEAISVEAYIGNILEGGTAFNANENGHEYIKDQILNALTITTEDVEDYIKGDVNQDGNVDVSDVQLLFEYVVGITSIDDIQIKVGDVNGDGTTDVSDVQYLFEYVVGISSVL